MSAQASEISGSEPFEQCFRSHSEPGIRRLLVVVEDDPNDFDLLRRAIEKAHLKAQVHWANSGTEALAILSHLGPRPTLVCVVVDVMLPEMSGFELLEKVRAMDPPIPARFVFVTGNAQPSIESRARACGADGFFLKSCFTGDLIEIVRAVERLLLGSTVPGQALTQNLPNCIV